MTFFDWHPDAGQSMLSPYIWIYVALTLLLTTITMGTWLACSRKRKKRDQGAYDEESG